MTSNDQQIDLVINRLKRAQYEDLCQQGKIDETQLYMITDDPDVSSVVSSYISDYYPKSETSSATEIQNAFDNIPKPDMSEYYKKAETSSASEISSILNDFAKISVDNEHTQDLHLRHVSYDEYSKLVTDEQVDPHTLYILSAEGQDDQFGNRIVNVGEPISADDAATKGYVDDAISSIPAPDLSNYVKTSSDVEQKISSDIYVKGWVKVGNLSVGSSTPKSEWGWIVGDIERQKDLKSKFDYVESEIGTVSSDLIITKAEAADIKTKIPNEATSDNQLADKDFVNSSIVTNTAYFKGTYDSVEELPTTRVTPNDYAFVIRNDEVGQTFYDRYKFTADGEWLFEYSINNSGFTAAQFATINSGVTKDIVDKRVIPSTVHTGWAVNSDNAETAQNATYAADAGHAQEADTASCATQAGGVQGYTETLFSGETEDGQIVSFYILTKNA